MLEIPVVFSKRDGIIMSAATTGNDTKMMPNMGDKGQYLRG